MALGLFKSRSEGGSQLTNEELIANIILLFGAGHETTVNLLGNGLLALHRNPEQLDLPKARPELMVNAVEEFLRYDSSVQFTGRVALEDIDDLGGMAIARGQSLLCLEDRLFKRPFSFPTAPRTRQNNGRTTVGYSARSA